ncbi:MAG: hypothetical protein A3G35_01110 [candidate division NC10 bacterium RIFCSPLOWO2_12_FULL_66_18]|nr:MAG: hypothetical protein A3H39_02945 [candidate division NC10 bacterium RIFCSPLOWO2_02_FULL_66_22]OGC02585.1 MAG: hypothetical protein A3G35_01110 [candidate division NC10 bacterium RIFCSPLOWO2_12_FULL_66_18]
MRKLTRWTTLSYGLLLLIAGSIASVALFFYAFLTGRSWSPFFWAFGLLIALVVVMKVIALGLDDEANLRLAGAIAELLEGTFGWMWIGVAGLSVLMFFRALLFRGAWSDFFVCLLVSGIFKWFMSWSMNTKRGAVFKKDLVEKGLTKEQAREVWIAEMRRGLRQDNPPRSPGTK